jgi:hypothetical protein
MADASGKKTKKIATARKNSNVNAHCTHLPLPATHKTTQRQRQKSAIANALSPELETIFLTLKLKIF